MKREGASTLFIHDFPWPLSYLLRSLALFCLKWCLVWFLKVFCKEAIRLGNLCNDSRS